MPHSRIFIWEESFRWQSALRKPVSDMLTVEELITFKVLVDSAAAEAAGRQWNSIAKPLGSLGLLEEDVIRIAALTGDPDVRLDRRALLVFCADNGVVAQGVAQTS